MREGTQEVEGDRKEGGTQEVRVIERREGHRR